MAQRHRQLRTWPVVAPETAADLEELQTSQSAVQVPARRCLRKGKFRSTQGTTAGFTDRQAQVMPPAFSRVGAEQLLEDNCALHGRLVVAGPFGHGAVVHLRLLVADDLG